MSTLLAAASALCLAAGAFFAVVGCLGLVRMPALYPRMHAASVTDTLGAGLLLLGMMLAAGASLVTAKLILLGMLLFLTSPTATHALAQAALARDPKTLEGDQGPWQPKS